MVQSTYNIEANLYAGSDRRWYVAVTTAMRTDEIEDAASSWTGQYSVDKKTTEESVELKLRCAEPDQDYQGIFLCIFEANLDW
jgi:hypothetical protein